ncbi:PIN domain-containing protein [Candidatus Woesearchaeota archaeon]|nr:PIN domain-containing protein [Candidatus Woesearchaeota archaeon]
MLLLHYPDSCIFLELFSKEKENKKQQAQAYLYDINRKYKAIISNLTYGEISRGLVKIIPKETERAMAFHKINDILENIEITSPQFDDFELALELRKIYYKLEPADALHLAMAINKGAKIFSTLGERS